MTEAAPASPSADTKKKRKKRFPSARDFANKGAYYEAMIKLFQDKLADFKKHGDGESAKKIKKGRKIIGDLDELMKDPACADILMEMRKKLAPGKPVTK